MEQFIKTLIAQILSFNPTIQITYEGGLLYCQSALGVVSSDKPEEIRSILCGMLIGVSAPKPMIEDDEDVDFEDEDDEDDEDDDHLSGIAILERMAMHLAPGMRP